MNEEEICDEEKHYHEWVKNNTNYLAQNKMCISVMKKIYMDAFAAGFTYRLKITAMEQLQK